MLHGLLRRVGAPVTSGDFGVRCIVCHRPMPALRWWERGLLGVVFAPAPYHDPRKDADCWFPGTGPISAVIDR